MLRKSALAASMLAAAVTATPAAADDGAGPEPAGDGIWLTLGVAGIVIDTPDLTACGDDCNDTGQAFALSGAFTFGGDVLFRARANAFKYTSNSAGEFGGLVGLRVGETRDWAWLVGLARLSDVSESENVTNGKMVEILYAPRDGRSIEASLFANFNPDHDFIGLHVGFRFGSLN